MATYAIRADAIYTEAETVELALAVIKDGEVLTSASNATAELRQLNGTLLDSFTSEAAPDTQGIFSFEAVTRTLAPGSMYYIKVTALDGTVELSDVIFIKRFN